MSARSAGATMLTGTAAAGDLDGEFQIGGDYGGCPHCGARSFVQCGGCRRLSCWPGTSLSEPFTCGWCGNSGSVSEERITSLGRVD